MKIMSHSFGFYGQHQWNEAIKSGATADYGQHAGRLGPIRDKSDETEENFIWLTDWLKTGFIVLFILFAEFENNA